MADLGHQPRPGLCRDCVTAVSENDRRCPQCHSPRIVRHPELSELTIAHVDCDAFYAAVEKRDNPDLVDKPVIIGGGHRGVVSTACYVARIHGIHSAMPMFKALKACPEAVVVKPDMAKYTKVGHEIRTMMQELTPLVEPLSIDEAFLDLTGTERLHGRKASALLANFALEVERRVGITVSVGLSYNKFLAKVASDLEKPRGFSVIGQAEALDFLADKPVNMIWGVGKAFQAKLHRDGIRTIGQIRGIEESELMRRYGVMGRRLWQLSQGLDSRVVSSGGGAKSISAETTFNTDVSDEKELTAILRSLSEKVSARMKKAGYSGRTVTLKLKTKDFKSLTRSRQLPEPTRLADRLFRAGVDLLRPEIDGRKYRLIGIGLSDLQDLALADPDDLVDEAATKRAHAELAIDRLKSKYGDRAVELGLVHDHRHRRGKS